MCVEKLNAGTLALFQFTVILILPDVINIAPKTLIKHSRRLVNLLSLRQAVPVPRCLHCYFFLCYYTALFLFNTSCVIVLILSRFSFSFATSKKVGKYFHSVLVLAGSTLSTHHHVPHWGGGLISLSPCLSHFLDKR